MNISEKNLRLMCEELMDKLWGDKLEIPVVISNRMTNSLGLFYSSTVYKNGQIPYHHHKSYHPSYINDNDIIRVLSHLLYFLMNSILINFLI